MVVCIRIYMRRPPQSVKRVRLQPSKSTMLFNIQAQAARHQPKQPRMTHACSSPGWMVQTLINYSSIGATARRNPARMRCHRLPKGLVLNPANLHKSMLPPPQE